MKLRFFTFYILCSMFSLSNIAFAQQDLNPNHLPEEELTVLNEYLPPNLSIDETGKLLTNQARTDVYLWDSSNNFLWNDATATWQLTYKNNSAVYDAQGNILEYKRQDPNPSTGNFESTYCYQYAYALNRMSVLGLNWNGVTWDSSVVVHYEYNADGYIILQESFLYDLATFQWMPSNRYENTYNSSNELISRKRYSGNNPTNSWTPLSDYSLTYDSNDKLIQISSSSQWNTMSSTWNYATIDSFFYNVSNELTLRKQYTWDNVNATLTPVYNILITVDNNGNVIQDIRQVWTAATQTWTNEYRNFYTFNTADLLTLQTREEWLNTVWSPVMKIENTYNSNGQQTLGEDFWWENSAWVMISRVIRVYGSHGNQVHMEHYNFNSNTGNQSYGFQNDAYYSLYTITNTQKLESKTLQAYPNPTSSSVLVELPDDFTQGQLTIWDMQGRLLHSQDYQGELIDLSTYSNGVYWLQVVSDTERYTVKVIKN